MICHSAGLVSVPSYGSVNTPDRAYRDIQAEAAVGRWYVVHWQWLDS